MRLEMLALFGLAFGLLTLVAFYVTRRLRELLGRPREGDAPLRMTLLLIGLTPLLRFLAGVGPLVETLATIGFAVSLSMVIATAALLPIDAIRAIARWVERRSARSAGASVVRERAGKGEAESATTTESETQTETKTESDTTTESAGGGAVAVLVAPATLASSRRLFLRRASVGSALALGGGTSLYGVTVGRHDYVLEHVPIRLARLPQALDGYTIAQLSDVHVGTFVQEYELSVAYDLLARARADLIVLTGDLIDHDARYFPQLGRALRRIVDLAPRDGVVAILGNHEYYAGADAAVEVLRRAGVRVLRNEAMTLGDAGGRFALLGVDDVWAVDRGHGAGADLPRVLAAAEPDLLRVLLCHNPELFPEAAEHVDLQLSGHTHGGQVNFLVHPIELVLDHGYIAGRYTRGDAQIYVNRGFGTAGPPARVQTPPEVARIVLARG